MVEPDHRTTVSLADRGRMGIRSSCGLPQPPTVGATTRMKLTTTLPTLTTPTKDLPRLAKRNRTLSASLTCTATQRNGPSTSTAKTVTPRLRRNNRSRQSTSSSGPWSPIHASSAAGVGKMDPPDLRSAARLASDDEDLEIEEIRISPAVPGGSPAIPRGVSVFGSSVPIGHCPKT